MRAYLTSLGFDVWDAVVDGYKESKTPLINKDDRLDFTYTAKEMNLSLVTSWNQNLSKLCLEKWEKETWDKLHSTYEGDEYVKKAKLQVHQMQFEKDERRWKHNNFLPSCEWDSQYY